MYEIFKAYDIRGIYPSELDEQIARRIGRAFVSALGSKKVIVGRDCRISSPKLAAALIEGILEQGADVIDIGLCSTPMIYFASQSADAIMVTASHNPKEYNGFKLCKKGGIRIAQKSGISKIEQIFKQGKFVPVAKAKGKHFKRHLLPSYVFHVLKFARGIKKLKLVVDGGNGMAGLTFPAIARRLPCKVIPLCFKLDGNFPNHPPNPFLTGVLKELQERVVKEGADLGIAFDADCDRVAFVDEKGKIARGDLIALLIARDILKRKAGAKIFCDVRCSRVVEEEIKRLGGRFERSKVGHAFIANKMRKEDAEFAGELSEHYYFKENFYCDSGDIAVIHMLNILSEEKKPLSALIKPFQRYYQSGELSFEASQQVAKRIVSVLVEIYSSGRQSRLDGLTVEYKDWWFNIRPSHTEAMIRLNVEAKTKKLLDKRLEEIKKHILGNI
ncbi:MAG: phosphomannomutase/phosphoglucomutase [Candidatus Woesearchaeota archaeon]